MKKIGSTLLIVLFFLVGLSLLLYPTVSNWYNEQVGSYTLSNYQKVVDESDDGAYQEMLDAARAYNDTLATSDILYVDGEAEDEAYINTLDVYNGVMGSLVIDAINVNLPIYHGTNEAVLQQGIGHLEGSSLPTGDAGNHTVLTGHTGLPSATLLSNLDQLEIGDTFEVHVLNDIYTYEVFDILVVEPQEVDSLAPVEGKDIVTLVTCTPYGVNSHRLLVQGAQISCVSALDTVEEVVKETVAEEAEAVLFGYALGITETELMRYTPLFAVAAVLTLFFLVVLLLPRRKKKENQTEDTPE